MEVAEQFPQPVTNGDNNVGEATGQGEDNATNADLNDTPVSEVNKPLVNCEGMSDTPVNGDAAHNGGELEAVDSTSTAKTSGKPRGRPPSGKPRGRPKGSGVKKTPTSSEKAVVKVSSKNEVTDIVDDRSFEGTDEHTSDKDGPDQPTEEPNSEGLANAPDTPIRRPRGRPKGSTKPKKPSATPKAAKSVTSTGRPRGRPRASESKKPISPAHKNTTATTDEEPEAASKVTENGDGSEKIVTPKPNGKKRGRKPKMTQDDKSQNVDESPSSMQEKIPLFEEPPVIEDGQKRSRKKVDRLSTSLSEAHLKLVQTPKPKTNGRRGRPPKDKSKLSHSKPGRKRGKRTISDREDSDTSVSGVEDDGVKTEDESAADTNSVKTVDDEELPEQKKVKIDHEDKTIPSDNDLVATIRNLLKDANLDEVTMKTVVENVLGAYPDCDLSSKREVIKDLIKTELQNNPV